MPRESSQEHTIVIVGAGTAGATVAARLRRAGARDVAVIDPYDWHYYQPLWTLVGGGRADIEHSRRPRASLMPRGYIWIKDAAVGVDPDRRTVQLRSGAQVAYRQLVMAPGLQLDWARIPGLAETIGTNGTSSNYRFDLAPKTWDLIRATTSGTAVFAMPAGPIKCAGAPRRSPTSPQTTGVEPASWTTSTSTWCCRPPECSASRSSRRSSPTPPPTTG